MLLQLPNGQEDNGEQANWQQPWLQVRGSSPHTDKIPRAPPGLCSWSTDGSIQHHGTWRGWDGELHELQDLHSAPVSLHNLGQDLHSGVHLTQTYMHPPINPRPGTASAPCPASLQLQSSSGIRHSNSVCSQMQILSKHGVNLIKAEFDSRLQCWGMMCTSDESHVKAPFARHKYSLHPTSKNVALEQRTVVLKQSTVDLD